MAKTFERIAIINRGEPAMRFIHAVNEFNLEHNTQLKTIALFTESDENAMFVREADEVINIGQANFLDAKDGELKSNYINLGLLEEVLRKVKADAVWVGWGFVAEEPEFVKLCNKLGIVFIGPSAGAMQKLGDKISAKQLAEKNNIPVIPWSGRAVTSQSDARALAKKTGYPVIVKASAGGGGRGIRPAFDKKDIASAFEKASSEALRTSGHDAVFVEKLLEGVRHVEIQIVADNHGSIWPLGVRDCSVQRRYQKVIEEAPSIILTEELTQQLKADAVKLVESAGYSNLCSVEFLINPETGEHWFLEVNTRLQVEHAVTERTTGIDLVKMQILIASGKQLEGAVPETSGHAIEVRLNAEDPTNSFAPAPGLINVFKLPTGPGIRIETGFAEGDIISSEFDSMIAKMVVHGKTRQEALSKLKRALGQTSIIIEKGMSNKGFLLDLLNREEIQNSTADAAWLDKLVALDLHLSGQYAEVAVLHAAFDSYLTELKADRANFFKTAFRGRPEVSEAEGFAIELSHQNKTYKATVFRLSSDYYRLNINNEKIYVRTKLLGNSEWRTQIGEAQYKIFAKPGSSPCLVEVNGIPHRISNEVSGEIIAPAPAVVVSILPKVGDKIKINQRVAVLEAMKMETSIHSPVEGIVKQVKVRNNQQVAADTTLLVIEPSLDGQNNGQRDSQQTALDFSQFSSTDAAEIGLQETLAGIKSLLLGYDAAPPEVEHLIEKQNQLVRKIDCDNSELWRYENEILNIFIDLNALFSKESDVENDDNLVNQKRLSNEEYFYSYLRNIEAETEGIAEGFVKRLQRALGHYNVNSFEKTPQLDASLYRIFRSNQRMLKQLAPILSILQRRLSHSAELASKSNGEFRLILEKLISITDSRFPMISGLAREVSYHYFDQPILNQARKLAYDEASAHLAQLENNLSRKIKDEHIDALIACPQPLKTLLFQKYDETKPELSEILLETITRRYYRIRSLSKVSFQALNNILFLSSEYKLEKKRIHLFSCFSDFENLTALSQAFNSLIKTIADKDDIVIDIYFPQPIELVDTETTVNDLKQIFNVTNFSRNIRRIVVDTSGATTQLQSQGAGIFTFRQEENGFEEDRTYRSLHPMMGKRLEIWRLNNFNIERLLPSAEDVYVFKATAKDNPKDERLFVSAEVRDLTRVESSQNDNIQIPNLELMLQEALTSIRHFQSTRNSYQKFIGNQIFLYIWPTLDLTESEVQSIVSRLAPATAGLGIDKISADVKLLVGKKREPKEAVVEISNPAGGGVVTRFVEPNDEPIETLSEYEQKVTRLRRRGLIYPYELIKMLTPDEASLQSDYPRGEFTEYDLDESNQLIQVERPYGSNKANIIVGVIKNYTEAYPDGMERVVLLGDPIKAMGSLAEPECRRINAGLDLAEEMGVPLEWFAISAGAKIAMDSGTENMDWISKVLRRIIEFTQSGGEINIIVTGINVGAQPYWNAEATMLMHTRGILIMMPESAMVLTGKQALDYSGGVSAKDNLGIGGYERVMGPNGQAQYFAKDIGEACRILFSYYNHTYVVPGERFPRKVVTKDPIKRDVQTFAHGDVFKNLEEVFSVKSNPGRKQPFNIRMIMKAVIDQDHAPLERWSGMEDAEIAVIWDAHVGGYPVCLIGFESKPLPRLSIAPADGPEHWTGGTLFPLSSKKIARSINAATNNRPLVVMANLSGFDGSPESLRKWQLEYGAEIGRAVVNFKGPIVFCVVSRYHGGAFVVFSNALHDNMEIAALEGTYASVIGGAPAAAVVFARDVQNRTKADGRLLELEQKIKQASDSEKVKLQSQWTALYKNIHSEKLGEVADEFDGIHSVQRAQKVGSVDHIIPPDQLRPYVIEALERGMKKELEK